MKSIVLYEVWEATRPYLTTVHESLTEQQANELGFCLYDAKDIPQQWYITKPKTQENLARLKTALQKLDIIATTQEANETIIDTYGWEVYDGYEFGLKANIDGDNIIRALVEENVVHHPLTSANIACYFKLGSTPYDEGEEGTPGMMTFAQIQVANKVHEKFGHLDFLVQTWEESWVLMPPDLKKMVLDHELRHAGFSGGAWIRDHDIQNFSYMIKKYDLQLPYFNLPLAEKVVAAVLASRNKDDEEPDTANEE